MMEWFIPTFHGDISLTEREPGKTILRAHQLTPSEREALGNLRKRALARPWGCRPWARVEDFPPLNAQVYQVGKAEVALDVKLSTVRDFLARQLKPDRKLINAVLFKDGTLAEATFVEPEDSPPAETPPEPAQPPPRASRPAAGATVAKPTRGCPAPDFSPAEVRAKQVLCRFLNERQVADLNAHGRFVTVGSETGHRYMLTSRTCPDQLSVYGKRTLYDLDEQRAYCVHDWDVPAGEELLALHLFLTLPGRESYLRSIPE